jgi:hypothetical protein
LLGELLGEERESSESETAAALLARALRLIQPVVRLARSLGLAPHPGVLVMPEVGTSR